MIVLDGQRTAIGARVNLSRGTSVHPEHTCRPDVASVAVHEAGHAIVGRVYGLAVTGASILADVDTYGRVCFAPDSWAAAPMEAHLLALLAGQAAQDQASGWYGLPCLRFDGTDTVGARTILAHHFDITDWHATAVETGLVEWRQHACQSVYAAWPWIARVAEALLVRKCLTGTDVEGLRR